MYGHTTEVVNTGAQKLKELIGSQRTCMMTEATADGVLVSKPMTLLEVDDDGVMWFMTSLRLLEHSDWRVNVAFSNESDNTYVSVAGLAQATRDREKIRSLWSLVCKPWFPDGPESAEIVLIKVTPFDVEYWDGPSSVIARSASLLASVVAGKPVGMGEHGLIKP